MAKPLTQGAVNRLRPRAARFETRDGHQQGLYLVVQPTGAKSWALRTLIGGKSAKLTIGDAGVIPLVDARDQARAMLKEIGQGRDQRHEAAPAPLLEVVELYLKHHGATLRPRSRIEVERHLRAHWAPLHARPLTELTRREIAARLLELKDECGPVAANRARAALSALYAWAIKQGLVDANPVAATGKEGEQSRERVLSLDELRQLWAATASGSDHDAILRLLMLTGARKTEAGDMRWPEVDLDNGLWTLPRERTKNGRPHSVRPSDRRRVVPLSDRAADILAARPGKPGREFVFGEGKGGYSGWSHSKARLDRRCRLEPWTLHDLRRSFVTHVVELNIAPPHVVEAVVNHVSGVKGGVAGIYNRASHLAERVRALQDWSDYLVWPTAG